MQKHTYHGTRPGSNADRKRRGLAHSVVIVGRAVPFCASGDERLKVYAASIRELLHCVIIDAVLVNPYADDVMRIMCCFELGFSVSWPVERGP